MTALWFAGLILALGLLTKGADLVLNNAQSLGKRAGLTSFGAGAIIIGSLTSLPDLMAGIVAQVHGVSDIVTGTAVGANIADILLIAGLVAVMTRGIFIRSDVHFDVGWLGIATSALVFVAWDGSISQQESLFLLLLFALYIGTMYAIARENRIKQVKKEHAKDSISKRTILSLLVGFSFLITGAHIAVEASLHLSEAFNIATGIIGLFAIALGTTLPEFFITIRSVRDNARYAPLAIGNVFGSNIFNALVVVGIPGLLAPIHLDPVTGIWGIVWMIAATIAFGAAVFFRRKITFLEGILYLLAYLLFVVFVAGIL